MIAPKVPDKELKQIAFKALELMEEQIGQGIDAEGKPYEYSTKPYAQPVSRQIRGIKKFEGEGRLKRFKNQQGKMWLIVTNGYKDYRRMTGRDPEGDFLQFSGRMLSSMNARAQDGEAEVYFTDEEQAKKAFWLSRSGAGKSRKIWNFFGLTDENKQKLEVFTSELLNQSVPFVDEVKKLMTQMFGTLKS